jgi:hypothetical protein
VGPYGSNKLEKKTGERTDISRGFEALYTMTKQFSATRLGLTIIHPFLNYIAKTE